MIQFNLLPDVKLKFIKAQRLKHIVVTVSVLSSVVAVGILIIAVLLVDGLQKKSLNDLNNDTTKYTAQIQNTAGLNKVLTIQNQLQSLPALDAQKPALGRLFSYLSQTTPLQASIGSIKIDIASNSWEISGTADSYKTIDQFVDTYKFTTYNIKGSSANPNVFSNVVLKGFGAQNNLFSYDITANFAAPIFKSTDQITLSVPNIISTRSETQQPQILFNKPAQ